MSPAQVQDPRLPPITLHLYYRRKRKWGTFQVRLILKEKPLGSNVSKDGNVIVNTIGNPGNPAGLLKGGPAGTEVTVKVLYLKVSKNMLLAQRPEAKVMVKDNRIKVVKGQGDQVLVEAMEAALVKIIIMEVALVKIIVRGLYLSMNNNWPSPLLVSPISILSLVSIIFHI